MENNNMREGLEMIVEDVNNRKEVRAVKKVAKNVVTDKETYKTLGGFGALAGLAYANKKLQDGLWKDVKRRGKKMVKANSFAEGLVQAGIIGLELTGGVVAAGASVVLGTVLLDSTKTGARNFVEDLGSDYRQAIFEIEEEEFNSQQEEDDYNNMI